MAEATASGKAATVPAFKMELLIMPGNVKHIDHVQGLPETSIPALQHRFGKNVLKTKSTRRLQHSILDVIREPMFLLLVVTCTLYFILQQPQEGWLMMTAIVLVVAISIYQDMRSTRALHALNAYTEPSITVIRDGMRKNILSEELVPGDVLLLEEGNKVPADASIIQANDLSINESIITGESLPVEKHEGSGNNLLYQGSTINSGSCYAVVTATGNTTILGQLGKSITASAPPKTLLQSQVNRFVKALAFFGIAAFLAIWTVNYTKSHELVQSLLFALTLAMAAIPEEIPVAFSSFMALGAYRMSRLGIISRQPQTIENLGAVTMLCLDKTGTITQNKMTVQCIYEFNTDTLIETGTALTQSNVLGFAMLACEHHPFDAMENAIHEAYRLHAKDFPFGQLQQVYEYPLEGKPPMMTHVYEQNNESIVAGKGAPERILRVCRLEEAVVQKITRHITAQAKMGYRVIAVASATHSSDSLPLSQDEFKWHFEGFLCLYDPPKENVQRVVKTLYQAGIDIKLITGDYAETAANIASRTGIKGFTSSLTGDAVMNMTDGELQDAVSNTVLFARMFPEAKERVINALKSNGHIVAMTGDGVNDAPALKAADIGIAMGKKGTEIARLAADLVLTDDNLEKIPEAIQQGRQIFNNLKKAVRYIISIHIPIILTAALPLLLNWKYPNLFTPVHIIFLELIMGPTCSIFFERDPLDKNAMLIPPRRRQLAFFAQDELFISIMQGIMITIGVLWLYHFSVLRKASLGTTRTMVFTTLIISNIFLTFANRSFNDNITKTVRYKNNLTPVVLLLSVLFLLIIHLVLPVRSLFGLTPVSFADWLLCTGIALLCVGWFELYKTHAYKPGRPIIFRKE